MRTSFAVVVVISLAVPAEAQTLLQAWNGDSGWMFGQSAHQTADQNNDCFSDALVGAAGANGGRGLLRAACRANSW